MEDTVKGNDIVVSRNPAAALIPHNYQTLGPCYASSSLQGENAIGYQRNRVAETAAKRPRTVPFGGVVRAAKAVSTHEALSIPSISTPAWEAAEGRTSTPTDLG